MISAICSRIFFATWLYCLVRLLLFTQETVQMYISVQVTIVLGRVIVPWTIVDFHEENVTFSEFFSCIKAGQYHIEVTEELKRARLLKTFVGNKVDALIVSGIDQCVIPVCSQFGIYVKFAVELISPSTSEEMMSV